MKTSVLKEQEWNIFIQNEILPLITRSRNKSGMTTTSSGMTTASSESINISSEMMDSTVFALVGDLGVGKTTFSKTFLHELGVKQHVQSPTFSIINSYDISFKDFTKVFHIDLYRIEDIKELEVLHMSEILSNPKHIVVIEWADKFKTLIPEDAVWIYFEHDTLETRKVKIDNKNNI